MDYVLNEMMKYDKPAFINFCRNNKLDEWDIEKVRNNYYYGIKLDDIQKYFFLNSYEMVKKERMKFIESVNNEYINHFNFESFKGKCIKCKLKNEMTYTGLMTFYGTIDPITGYLILELIKPNGYVKRINVCDIKSIKETKLDEDTTQLLLSYYTLTDLIDELRDQIAELTNKRNILYEKREDNLRKLKYTSKQKEN